MNTVNWVLMILILNVPTTGWEGYSYQYDDQKECKIYAKELNDREAARYAEANRLNVPAGEQVIAWCEKN